MSFLLFSLAQEPRTAPAGKVFHDAFNTSANYTTIGANTTFGGNNGMFGSLGAVGSMRVTFSGGNFVFEGAQKTLTNYATIFNFYYRADSAATIGNGNTIFNVYTDPSYNNSTSPIRIDTALTTAGFYKFNLVDPSNGFTTAAGFTSIALGKEVRLALVQNSAGWKLFLNNNTAPEVDYIRAQPVLGYKYITIGTNFNNATGSYSGIADFDELYCGNLYPAPTTDAQRITDAYRGYVLNHMSAEGQPYRGPTDGANFTFATAIDTVSEGAAYILKLAVQQNDQTTFINVDNWVMANLLRSKSTLANTQSNGAPTNALNLMAFHYNSANTDGKGRGTFYDANWAGDADPERAQALLWAHNRFGSSANAVGIAAELIAPNYLQRALNVIIDMRTYAFSSSAATGYQYLLNDSFQQGNNVVQLGPDYNSPGAFKLFAQHDSANATFWNNTILGAYDILNKTADKIFTGQTVTAGLNANWIEFTLSTAVVSANASTYGDTNYGFNAFRTYVRLYSMYYWYADAASLTPLQKPKTFFTNQYAGAGIKATYNHDGTNAAGYEDNMFNFAAYWTLYANDPTNTTASGLMTTKLATSNTYRQAAFGSYFSSSPGGNQYAYFSQSWLIENYMQQNNSWINYGQAAGVTTTAVTKVAQYTVRKSGAQTKAIIYDVRKVVAVTKSVKYTVNKAATALTKSLKYTVVKALPITKSTKYAVKPAAIASSKAVTYRILKTLAQTKAVTYDVKKSISLTKTLKYTTKVSAAAVTKGVIYRVRKSITSTKSAKYTTKAPVTALTKSSRYTIRRNVATTKAVVYTVAKPIAVAKALTYRVVKAAALTKALKYTTKRAGTLTKNLTYQTRKALAATKVVKYTTRTPASITKAVTYRVRKALSLSQSLRYAVAKSGAITKAINYDVKAAASVTKTLQYRTTNENITKLTQAVKYSIKRTRRGETAPINQNPTLNPQPVFVAAQTTTPKWIDGTAAGSTTNTYGWHASFTGANNVRFDTANPLNTPGGSIKCSLVAVGNYFEIRNNAMAYFTTNQTALKPDTNYKISGWVMAQNVSGSSTTAGAITFLTSTTGGGSAGSTNAVSGIVANQAWTYYETIYKTASTAAYGHIEARVYGHTGAATLLGDFWFANLQVQEMATMRQMRYALRLPTVNITKALKYTIKTTGQLTRSVKYTVKVGPSITKSLQYSVKKTNSVTKAINYRVKTVAGITKSLRYTTKKNLGITKSTQYAIKKAIMPTKVLTYRIKKSISQTKSLKYSIRKTFSVTRSLRYAIKKTNPITKSTTYTVFIAAKPTEPIYIKVRVNKASLSNDSPALRLNNSDTVTKLDNKNINVIMR